MYDKARSILLKPSAIAVIPTDTVYGVVARAQDEAAVQRLYALKHRENKPGTVVAANLAQLEQLGFKYRYLKAVEQFWPGAVSVIIPLSDPALTYLHQGKRALAVRVPNNPALQDLLRTTGPLMTSSANDPGEPTASTVQQAQEYFGDKVDVYVDGGEVNNPPSTIIRIIDDAIEVVREGAVKINDGTIQP